LDESQPTVTNDSVASSCPVVGYVANGFDDQPLALDPQHGTPPWETSIRTTGREGIESVTNPSTEAVGIEAFSRNEDNCPRSTSLGIVSTEWSWEKTDVDDGLTVWYTHKWYTKLTELEGAR
jgi:hypothetical protein